MKTVVCELLACTQPNCHKTSTAFWNPYRRVSLRGRRAQLRFSRGAHDEKPESDCPPFWFYRESIRTSMHSNSIALLLLHSNSSGITIGFYGFTLPLLGFIQRSTDMEWPSLDHCHGPLLALSTIIYRLQGRPLKQIH